LNAPDIFDGQSKKLTKVNFPKASFFIK